MREQIVSKVFLFIPLGRAAEFMGYFERNMPYLCFRPRYAV